VSRALRALVPRLALLLSLPALACAMAPRAPRPLPAEDPRPAALLGGLAHAAEGRRALRGVAQLALEGPHGSGRARQVLVLERPARLRVEVMGVLDQTLVVLTTDGEHYRLLRVPERSFDSGLVYPDLLRDVAGLAVTPEQAVELLLGVPLPPAGTHIEGAALLGEGGMRVEVGAGGGAGRQVFEFDAASRLRRWAELGPTGEEISEARFDDYRPLGGEAFAHDIALVDRVSGARARVSFASVELNPALPPGVFELATGGRG